MDLSLKRRTSLNDLGDSSAPAVYWRFAYLTRNTLNTSKLQRLPQHSLPYSNIVRQFYKSRLYLLALKHHSVNFLVEVFEVFYVFRANPQSGFHVGINIWPDACTLSKVLLEVELAVMYDISGSKSTSMGNWMEHSPAWFHTLTNRLLSRTALPGTDTTRHVLRIRTVPHSQISRLNSHHLASTFFLACFIIPSK
jgi:hypothetical protein